MSNIINDNKKSHDRIYDEIYKELEKYKSHSQSILTYTKTPASTSTIDKNIKTQSQIRREDADQNIRLKKYAFFILFGFLAVETIAVFVFTAFQAWKFYGFELEEWSFKLLLGATLFQITFMIKIAVRHLFPDGKSF